MLSESDLLSLLGTGREHPHLEVKGAGSRATDKQLTAKVIRAALSMGNRSGGGSVIIGIADSDIAAMQPGLDDEQLQSWLAYDDVARKLSEYSDPPLVFNLQSYELPNGAKVVAIHVEEFADIPHLCKKSYDTCLSEGKLYVRSRTVPETVEVSSSVQMRDILELATQKRLRAFVTTANRAGVALVPVSTQQSDESNSDTGKSNAAYEAQQGGAW